MYDPMYDPKKPDWGQPIVTNPLKAVPEHDAVNHPSHYTAGGIECIDYIEAKGFGYHLGNAVKYISRAALKGNHEQDIKKAIWYLNRYLEKYNDGV